MEKEEPKVSPFISYPYEVKKNDSEQSYVSITQIINKLNRDHIKRLEFEIIEIINQYDFLTSKQLMQLLTKRGVEVPTYKKLNTKLDQMRKTRLILRSYFETLEKQSTYKVYSLDKNGKYLLEAKDIQCFWKPTQKLKQVASVKRTLAANQLVIAYEENVKNLRDVDFRRKLKAGTDVTKEDTIDLSRVLTLGKNASRYNVIVEPVRREENWQERMKKRLKIFSYFLANFKSGDSDFYQKPYILFLCEDKNHMVELYKEIVLENIDLEDKAFFTTDLDQLDTPIYESWYEFKLTSDAVKCTNVSLDILK